jgi:hypothetical protein
MKKLKLDLEALHVDSFQTAGDAGTPRGTVQANSIIMPIVSTDDPFGCLNSIGWSCGFDCLGAGVGVVAAAAGPIRPIVSTDEWNSCLNSIGC